MSVVIYPSAPISFHRMSLASFTRAHLKSPWEVIHTSHYHSAEALPMDTENIKMASTKLSEDSRNPDREEHVASLVEQQTRTLRLFSMSQLFAFVLLYLGTWHSVAMYVILTQDSVASGLALNLIISRNMYFALANGGPTAWFWI